MATLTLTTIVKRNGRTEEFQPQKITNAIRKAGKATGEFGEEVAKTLTVRVVNIAQQMFANETPSVEGIQDIVEEVLLSSLYRKTTKAYILYRQKHAEIREIASKFNTDLVDQYLNQNDWLVRH